MQILMMAGTGTILRASLRKSSQSPLMDSRFRENDSPLIGVKIGVKMGFLSRNGFESRPLRQEFGDIIL